jgi:hypothetical protein
MVSGTFSQRLVLGQGFLECDSATGLRLQGQAYWQLTIDKLTRSLGQTQEIEPHQSSNFSDPTMPSRSSLPETSEG